MPARFLLGSLVIFLISFQEVALSQSLPPGLPSDMEGPLSVRAAKAIEFALNCRYGDALALADSVIVLAPEHPSGYLLQAGIRELKALDYGSHGKDHLVDMALGNAILKGENFSGKPEVWGFFYLGAAYGLKGVYLGKRGLWTLALNDIWKGLSFFKKSMEAEPSLYDSYLGIGIYRYWKSKLSWLPMIRDEREGSIALMDLAAEKSLYLKDISLFSISWAVMDSGDRERALEISKELVSRYPESRLFKDSLAGALKRNGELEDAYHTYHEIFESYRIDSMEESPGALCSLWDMANVAFMMEKYDACLDLCSRITGSDLRPGGDASRKLARRALERSRSHIKSKKLGRR